MLLNRQFFGKVKLYSIFSNIYAILSNLHFFFLF